MDSEVLRFISNNKLVPFSDGRVVGGESVEKRSSIFKTKEARAAWRRVREALCSKFVFSSTKEVVQFFEPSGDLVNITQRQMFWRQNLKLFQGGANPLFLTLMRTPVLTFRMPYRAIVAVSDERLLMRLKERKIPVVLVSSRQEARNLDRYEVVYGVNGDDVCLWLEDKEGFFETLETGVYVEQFVELLSMWAANIRVLFEYKDEVNRIDSSMGEGVVMLYTLLSLFENSNTKVVSKKELEEACYELNSKVREELKGLTVSAENVVSALSLRAIPPEIEQIVRRIILDSGYSRSLFETGFPIRVDEREVERMLNQSRMKGVEHFVRKLKEHATALHRVPQLIAQVEAFLVYVDFVWGVGSYGTSVGTLSEPKLKENGILLDQVSNILLDKPEPITFLLDSQIKCSILTGANSGGKTTLLEHIIQIIGLTQMGLPLKGRVEVGVFESVHYFAKNKGSTSKGAFETMLTELSKIKGGPGVLILADEMEAVTEPGVAAHIISATCSFFMSKECYMVVATHLGDEIIRELPMGARVDGISATGLDSDMNLIVSHNPVLGKLANSTPELIVERLSKVKKGDYFLYLYEQLKGREKRTRL